MNLPVMSPGTLHRLCDPVDPHNPQILHAWFDTTQQVLYEMRTLELPRDINWLLQWIGPEGYRSIPDPQTMSATLYHTFSREASLSTIQAVVITEQTIPRLLLNICIEANPFSEISGSAVNYVLYPTIDVSSEPMAALGALRHAIIGCFGFQDVNGLFVHLDKHQADLEELTTAAGFRPVSFASLHQKVGTGYFHLVRPLIK